MRILTTNLLAAALLLFGAASASAFAVNMVASTPTTGLTTSDNVIVDVFLDSDGPITIFSVAVVNSDPSALLYNGAASAALPTNPAAGTFGGSNGNQSSYILYETVGRATNYLVPAQTPYFLNFPPETAGTEQVNINYNENALGTTNATGNGVYIATLLFHIVADFTTANLSLAFTTSNLIQAGTVITDPNLIGLSSPIVLTGVVPEPTTAMLIGLGVLGLGFAGRRRV
jgi:hypothetical protein